MVTRIIRAAPGGGRAERHPPRTRAGPPASDWLEARPRPNP